MPATSQYDRPASYYMNQGVDGQPLPTISDRLRSMGMDSSVENRPMLMPIREEGEWTAPEWFHSMARGAMVPAQAVLGGTVTPLDTAMATADYAGGGLLSSKAIPNAVPDGAVLGATVYHGSPHKFDKFDMSKVGTGEGAQAYGHGLYFADNPTVAKNYVPRDMDAEEEIMSLYKGAEQRGDYTKMEMYENALLHDAPSEIRDRYTVANGYDKDFEKAAEEVAYTLERIGNNEGNLYKVDLPDEHIDKMLDWDKPLSEQPQVLQDMARKSDLTGMKEGNRTRRMIEKWRDGTEQADYPATGHTFYNSLSEYGQESVPELSQKLYEAGITGIKYLDQGSRHDGKGTSNYVVFDDTLPTILGRE